MPLPEQPSRASDLSTGRQSALLPLLLLLAGCASGPVGRFDALLSQHALEAATVKGTEFRHLYLRKPARADQPGLRVYLEGDGIPWIRGRRVAQDATTRNPVALRLMLQDPGRALYLARPCYHRIDASPPCHPRLWTRARYGEDVVASMAAALRRLLDGADGPVTLVGFSGGGTLAMLLARRLDEVDRVVTLAANLDTAAWAKLHGYSPLSASLNPAAGPALPPHVAQLHLAGAEDRTVPPALIRRATAGAEHAVFAVFAGFDHRCCWEAVWGQLLEALKEAGDACSVLARSLPVARCSRGGGAHD